MWETKDLSHQTRTKIFWINNYFEQINLKIIYKNEQYQVLRYRLEKDYGINYISDGTIGNNNIPKGELINIHEYEISFGKRELVKLLMENENFQLILS